ncbi:hypothetical protein FKP32DRAFT_1603555 [Trametes sanguinea]|nr:hypothetical protein FKP32DRAFT_1603555 [Trametes sanguinea]
MRCRELWMSRLLSNSKAQTHRQVTLGVIWNLQVTVGAGWRGHNWHMRRKELRDGHTTLSVSAIRCWTSVRASLEDDAGSAQRPERSRRKIRMLGFRTGAEVYPAIGVVAHSHPTLYVRWNEERHGVHRPTRRLMMRGQVHGNALRPIRIEGIDDHNRPGAAIPDKRWPRTLRSEAPRCRNALVGREATYVMARS